MSVAASARAMDPDRAMSQYVRERWGSERGFPGGEVQAIAQTGDGYLWIGTEKGLVRFDGLTFHLVPDASSSSASTGPVLGLMADGEGHLWVRRGGSNLLRYLDGQFESALWALYPREDAITAMCRARDGSVLLSGLVNGTMRYRAGRFETLARPVALPRTPVISMAETPDGRVWLGTPDAGLFFVEGGRMTPVTKGLPKGKINCLWPDESSLWIGTDRGVVRWNGAEITSTGVPSSLRRLPALAMLADRGKNLWVGTGSGLWRVNAWGGASLDAGAERGSVAVTALFEDREGNLWTGTASGIERLRDSSFTTYDRDEGLPSERNGPLHVDTEGRIWFAPTEGGLSWLEDGRVGRVSAARLDADVVYSIAGGREGLWLGRRHGGLTQLRFEGGSFRARSYTTADGLAEGSVYAVHEARDGTVWAGMLRGGLSALRNGRFTTYTVANGLSSDTVASIVEGAAGTMWFATPNGLSVLSSEGWRVHTSRGGLPSDDVNCLLEDSTGVLWIGTSEGLAFLVSGRPQPTRGGPASLRKPIFGLEEDRNGWLWMATASGVLRVKRDKLLQGSLGEGDLCEYGLADGLQGLAGVKRHRSMVADARGRLWLSMDRGLSVVDPARLAGESAPAIAHVLAVAADGNPLEPRGLVRVPAGRRRISFSFAGLSLSAPERVRFRYELEGFDHGWSEPTTTREAVYTNLDPGSYRFRVVASNGDGLWNGTEAALGVEIEPAWWQRASCRLSFALAVALALLGLYRLRLRQLTRQLGLRFEARLAERTRIAQELHDTLLQGLLSASLQLHIAVDQVPASSPQKPRFLHVLELMGRVIEEGRNALRGLRSSEGGAHDLEQAFSRVPQELDLEGEMGFRVMVEGSPRPLHPLIRDEVYRIGREALVNAFRHSRATRVEMELEYTADHLRLLVRDDGGGIDAQVLRAGREGHFGLSGMRERAESIGGRLRVWSGAGAGTEVDLSVPGRVAFPAPGPDLKHRWRTALHRRGKSGSEARSKDLR